jgi:hypothetical protein
MILRSRRRFNRLRPDANQKFMVYGEGLQSCGTWLDARTKATEQPLISRAGVLGYVTAAGDYGISLRETDPQGIEAAVDIYRRANPTRQIVEAARDVVKELSKR